MLRRTSAGAISPPTNTRASATTRSSASSHLAMGGNARPDGRRRTILTPKGRLITYGAYKENGRCAIKRKLRSVAEGPRSALRRARSGGRARGRARAGASSVAGREDAGQQPNADHRPLEQLLQHFTVGCCVLIVSAGGLAEFLLDHLTDFVFTRHGVPSGDICARSASLRPSSSITCARMRSIGSLRASSRKDVRRRPRFDLWLGFIHCLQCQNGPRTTAVAQS